MTETQGRKVEARILPLFRGLFCFLEGPRFSLDRDHRIQPRISRKGFLAKGANCSARGSGHPARDLFVKLSPRLARESWAGCPCHGPEFHGDIRHLATGALSPYRKSPPAQRVGTAALLATGQSFTVTSDIRQPGPVALQKKPARPACRASGPACHGPEFHGDIRHSATGPVAL